VADPGPDIDPLDVRYSYLFWVNRDERGFSVGGSVSDPRTGEILSAKPRMDSARIRTIGNYWDTYRPSLIASASGARGISPTADILDCGLILDDELARVIASAEEQRTTQGLPRMTAESFVILRQTLVTAHEVGHTFGFGHNWNSSMNDRASVMEYPSPRLTITANGRLDLRDAYQRDIGEYDVAMVRYSYTPFAADREAASLDAIVAETRKKGTPGFDPRWNRYDDLSSPAEYLRQTIAQRKILLANYGDDILPPGESYGELRNMRMWMAYLHHRWAIDSGVKHIGGMYDNIAVKGEARARTRRAARDVRGPAAECAELVRGARNADQGDVGCAGCDDAAAQVDAARDTAAGARRDDDARRTRQRHAGSAGRGAAADYEAW